MFFIRNASLNIRPPSIRLRLSTISPAMFDERLWQQLNLFRYGKIADSNSSEKISRCEHIPSSF